MNGGEGREVLELKTAPVQQDIDSGIDEFRRACLNVSGTIGALYSYITLRTFAMSS